MAFLILLLLIWSVFKLFGKRKKRRCKKKNTHSRNSAFMVRQSQNSSRHKDIAEHVAFHEMQQPIQSAYVVLDNKFRSFHITTMTTHDFGIFYDTGIELLKLLPQYVPMIRRDAELHDYDALYFYENVPIKLLDYCCRFGEIEKGRLVLSLMDNNKVFREEFFSEQFNLFYAREQAIRCAKDYLSRNGETAKTVMIKEMPYVEKEYLQWAMRFYKGFSVRKDGSKYFVSLCDIK